MAERGRPMLAAVEGVRSAQIGRGIENPSKFPFIVEWESVGIHDASWGTPSSVAFGTLFAGYSTGGAMEHFRFD